MTYEEEEGKRRKEKGGGEGNLNQATSDGQMRHEEMRAAEKRPTSDGNLDRCVPRGHPA